MSVYGSEANLGTFQNSFSEKSIRNAFIRKVYALLMIQLAITTTFICLFLYEPRVKMYSREHPEMFWIAFIMTIVLIITLVCCPGVRRSFPANLICLFLIMTIVLIITLACCPGVRRSFPANLICLFLFTIFESFLLGSAASRYDTEAVMLAVGICTVICLGLTLFAFQTKIDFTACSGFLFVALLILVCFGFVAMIFPGKIIQLLYASAAALIFSLYLVFDTQMMIGGKHKYSLSPEEYIFATLNLYLDIINIFMSILELVGLAQD